MKTKLKLAKTKLGLYPVTLDNIRHFSFDKSILTTEEFNEDKHNEARIDAAKEFIEIELKLDQNEINIENAKLAPKADSKILWINTTEHNVKKLYARAAAIKNKNIQLFTYYPAELWERKIALDKNLKEARSNNANLRTQIRLGVDDLELHTKYTNENIWQITPLTEYGQLPAVGTRTPKPATTFSPPRQRGVTYIGTAHNPKRPASSPKATVDKKPKV